VSHKASVHQGRIPLVPMSNSVAELGRTGNSIIPRMNEAKNEKSVEALSGKRVRFAEKLTSEVIPRDEKLTENSLARNSNSSLTEF